jgi:hypothetical protein
MTTTGRREEATLSRAHPQHVEIVRAHEAPLRIHHFTRRGRVAFGLDVIRCPTAGVGHGRGERDRFNTWYGCKLLLQPCVILTHARLVARPPEVKAFACRSDAHRDDTIRIEARIDGVELLHRAGEQACADQQHRGQRNFSHHETLLQTPMRAARNAHRDRRCTEVGTREGQRRHNREYESGRDRCQHREKQHAQIHAGFCQTRQLCGSEL